MDTTEPVASGKPSISPPPCLRKVCRLGEARPGRAHRATLVSTGRSALRPQSMWRALRKHSARYLWRPPRPRRGQPTPRAGYYSPLCVPIHDAHVSRAPLLFASSLLAFCDFFKCGAMERARAKPGAGGRRITNGAHTAGGHRAALRAGGRCILGHVGLIEPQPAHEHYHEPAAGRGVGCKRKEKTAGAPGRAGGARSLLPASLPAEHAPAWVRLVKI